MFDKTLQPVVDKANSAIGEVKNNANELLDECKEKVNQVKNDANDLILDCRKEIKKIGKLVLIEFVIFNLIMIPFALKTFS